MATIKSEYLLPNYDPEEVGMTGDPGEDGKTSYVHIAYANSSNGLIDFSTTDPTNRSYTGMYTDFEILDSTDPSKYTWQLTKGNTGNDGVGITNTSVEYNKSTNATTPPSTGWTTTIPSTSGGEYLWTRTTLTFSDGKTSVSYAPSRQGIDGNNGTLFMGETAPTDFAEGDTWFKLVGGKVSQAYTAKDGVWVEVAFESSVIAENIVGKTITGGSISGTTISGSEFINEYINTISGVNQVTDGKLEIENGILQAGATYYLTNAAGERLYKFATTEADIHQGTLNLRQRLFDDTGRQTSESTTAVSGGLISLSLSDASGNYNGILDAKSLTNTPWKPLTLDTNMYTVAENNPPMYRIMYNLDGSKTVKFKGQFKLISGNMKEGSEYYPFRRNNVSGTPTLLPTEIIPDQTEFAFAAGGLASGFKGNNGGRVGMTRTPNMVVSPGSGEYIYFGISSLSYVIN